ncbi:MULTISPECIES: HupE/UreJ family protein [Desulfosediminicola]|uniref:HupE/UreJ family protein n=1 Tax=Desulfosediminicola TaxID=2886823 RepID=UPI0010ABB4DC|nr:HupE/UreJ family protein [Desulfosediminicola ganghwensis]
MKTDKSAWLVLAAWLLLMAFPFEAAAHIAGGQATGFWTGLEHPWSGLDHIVAMVAVGLWGAQLGMPALWVLPVVFPMLMSVGAMLGLLGIPVPGVEVGIAVSAVALGIMVLGEVRPGMVVAMLVVGFFAIFHGHAHGTELPAGQSGLLYSMGFILGTGCLHGVGILIGLVHYYPLGKGLLRLTGGCIAVMGLFFLWHAVT